MHVRFCVITAIMVFAVLYTPSTAMPCDTSAARTDDVRALDGEWIFVEDRTEGRAVEQQQPSMSAKVTLRVEDEALVLVRRDGEIRIAFDGSPTDVAREGSASRYRGAWRDGVFEYESEPVREPGDSRTGGLIRWELRITDEGLLARVAVDPPSGFSSVALYRHPRDIALPEPTNAAIDDLAWLAGAWVGTRGTAGTTSIEERWSPPLGGAMLGISRTVSRGTMRAFEFLRIVERGGGLVYIAQPNGAAPTEFVLTEADAGRAVFENPRHDFPQRIVYELSPEGGLSASIGFARGGRPQRFEFGREGE
ncbi:MAG: hypothetical protein H6811_00485 [Phycisphaeraceae bacterium]|nr:hypothetical protein [Phycisphaeraceae bacterium]